MNRQFYIFTLLFLFLAPVANTQIIPFKNYSVIDGLPSNYVSDIVQDKKGYLWFATDIGLAKFDGYTIKNYTINDGLSDNYIRSLLVDNKDRIWAGTEGGGISILDGSHIKTISNKDGLFSDPVDKLFLDSDNNIWACGLENGVSIIKKDTILTFNSENSIIKSNVFCYYVDSKGIVWLGNYDGIYYYDTSLHQVLHPLLDTLIVWDIIEDNYNRIWIASQEHGVFCYDGDSVITYNINNGLSTNETLSLMEDSEGRILVGTYYGGINIIKNSMVNTELVNSTQDFWIWELFEDSKSRVWVRTQEQGVLLIRNEEISQYSKKSNLVSQYVLNLFEDSYGNIWFVSENGVSKYGKAFFEVFKNGFVGEDKHILSLYIANDGIIYTGSYSGLTEINNNVVIKTYSTKDGLSQKPTVGSVIEYSNKIWLGTYGFSSLENGRIISYLKKNTDRKYFDIYAKDLTFYNGYIYGATDLGLFVFNIKLKDFTFLNEENGLIDNNLYSLALDITGKIWCGSSNGLSIFDGSNFHNYTKEQGLPNNFCNDITFDSKGIAWIATDFGVCSAILSEDFVFSSRNYSIDDGLKSNSIVSVVPDDQGNVWLGHNKGVDCYNPKTKTIRNYGFLDGFLPVETTLGTATKDKSGNIYFGTHEGFVKYSPDYDVQNTQPPKIYIKGIHLYNDTSSIERYFTQLDSTSLLPKDLRLHHSKKNLYFEYVGLHYTIVEKNTYKYRLLGYDEKWSEPTTEIQSIPYQKLPHGKYTFQVLAANCDGVWTEKPADFFFQILPPFWKTWWFRVIEIISIIILLYLIIYFRERKLRYDKKVLKQKVKERTFEIEKQKDQLAEQRDEIVNQKKEITDSIQYAQHIQSAILPKDETISPLLKDYFILYKPRDIVSGDFYWIYGSEKRVIVVAADCTGHGVPGAFMSMLGVSILNEIATKGDAISAGEILDTLREHIINTLSHTHQGEQSRDGMDLALSIIDYNNYSVQFAGAYNSLILIREGEIEIIKGDKMPVGMHIGNMVSFASIDLPVQKGDCLYMYSDGYADQFGGTDEKKFKSAPFKRLLAEISKKPMAEQQQILDDTIEDWKSDQEQVDDILVMGIRIV